MVDFRNPDTTFVDKLDRRGTDFTTVSGAYNAAAVGDILYLRDHGPGQGVAFEPRARRA